MLQLQAADRIVARIPAVVARGFTLGQVAIAAHPVPTEDSSLEGRSEKATACRPSIMVAVLFESYINDTPKPLNKNNDQVDYKGINKVVQ